MTDHVNPFVPYLYRDKEDNISGIPVRVQQTASPGELIRIPDARADP